MKILFLLFPAWLATILTSWHQAPYRLYSKIELLRLEIQADYSIPRMILWDDSSIKSNFLYCRYLQNYHLFHSYTIMVDRAQVLEPPREENPLLPKRLMPLLQTILPSLESTKQETIRELNAL